MTADRGEDRRRPPSLLRHLFSVLALPFTVLVIVPTLVLLTAGRSESWPAVAPVERMGFAVGFLSLGAGLYLLLLTIRLFVRYGAGTLAPWDPTRRLVVRGIYRHVRNPMHTGVFLTLMGEALLARSIIVLGLGLGFLVVHLVYIPLIEERGLETRFGSAYRLYKENVPRWIPRFRPWIGPIDDSSGRG